MSEVPLAEPDTLCLALCLSISLFRSLSLSLSLSLALSRSLFRALSLARSRVGTVFVLAKDRQGSKWSLVSWAKYHDSTPSLWVSRLLGHLRTQGYEDANVDSLWRPK